MEEGGALQAMEYVNEQKALMGSVQNALRNFKKDPPTRKTPAYYETRLETLSTYRADFRRNHRVLLRMSDDKQVKVNYFDNEIHDQFEELYLDVVSTIRQSSSKTLGAEGLMDSSVVVTETNTTFTSSNEVPLPEVKLPTFNGDYVQWPTFKEIFLIHNSLRLNDIQRFHYLKAALGGEAAEDIKHISLLGENYQMAWEMINSIYDNKRSLFFYYMDVFDQQPPVVRDNATALKRFTQTSRSCTNSLEKLEINIGATGEVLVYYMLRKLPATIRAEWDRSLRKQKTIPKFNELCSFLDEQYQILVSSAKSNVHSTGKSPANEHKRRGELVTSAHVTTKSYSCPLCDSSSITHPIRECPRFLEMSIIERKAAVKKYKLCFNCLGYNHRAAKCSSRRTCSACQSRHHTLIHEDVRAELPASAETSSFRATFSIEPPANITHAIEPDVDKPHHVILPTAVVNVASSDGQQISVRAFLDQGSQASFVTERTVQLLRLSRKRAHVQINGLGERKVAEGRSYVMLTVSSRYRNDIQYLVKAYVLPKVCNMMPSSRLATSAWQHLEGLNLADPKYFEPQPVDLLLGSDVYDDCLLNEVCRAERGVPIAQSTSFGFIISGKASAEPTVTVTSLYTDIETDDLLRKFWELEEIGSACMATDEETWCEQHYQRTHTRLSTGKYLVRLPLLSEIDSSRVLGTSREMALKRFICQERRLNRDPELKQIYADSIKEYIELGQMKLVTTSEQQHEIVQNDVRYVTCCYLPHHPVIKQSSSTTKVRIVFDASAKTNNGKSLNDILAIGPTLHNDLAAVLLNWRVTKIVFMADIMKMYRCINVSEDDAQYQRILWRTDSSENIAEYYCSTVMFGTASAPFCAMRTLHQLADDEADNYPLAAQVIKHQMYVDDMLSGADHVSDALEIQRQVIGMLQRGTVATCQ